MQQPVRNPVAKGIAQMAQGGGEVAVGSVLCTILCVCGVASVPFICPVHMLLEVV